MPVEIELKLRLDPRHVARLRKHPLLKRGVHHVSRKLYTIYYDTPDLELWRAGIALRLRRTGTRWIQTIKGGGSVVAGLHQRDEFETEVAAPFPDVGAIGGALAEHFASLKLRARLKPLFVTEFTRARWTLAPAPGVEIEASIDRGVIKCGDATEPICELELEVKSGPPWRACQAAMQLLKAAPLLVEDRSKADRGIALFLRHSRAPCKAPPSPIAAQMTSNDAFKALVQSCLAHYIANQHGMLEDDDPEYLHQMRVALRRLRSVVDTFSPLFPAAALQAPDAETHWLALELGNARDWDVFATESLAPAAAGRRRPAGMATIAQSAARLHRDARRAARHAAASARAQGLLLALGGWLSAETWSIALDDAQRIRLQQPVAQFARTVLDASSRRVNKRGRHLQLLAPRELHRLRIAIKKLRYATDFFAALYPRNHVKPYLARLAVLQQILGLINDAATVPRLLEAVASSGILRREALDIILRQNASLCARLLKRLPHAWQQFRRVRHFW